MKQLTFQLYQQVGIETVHYGLLTELVVGSVSGEIKHRISFTTLIKFSPLSGFVKNNKIRIPLSADEGKVHDRSFSQEERLGGGHQELQSSS